MCLEQQIQQFDAKHGNNGIIINGWLVFFDGAKRAPYNPQGPMQEPPKEKQDCDKIQLQYQEAVLRRATENLNQKKQALAQKTRRKPPREVCRDFDERQNCEKILHNGYWLFSNGAVREGNTLGRLMGPPDDPRERARKIIVYYEVQKNRATMEFDNLKNNYMRHTKAKLNNRFVGSPPKITSEAVRELKELQAKIVQYQKGLDAAREQLEKSKPPRVRQREELSDKNRQECEQFVDAIKQIEI